MQYQPNPDVLFAILGGEAVLLHTQTEVYYSLDETSTRMWQLLVENGRPEAVFHLLLEEYEIDEITLQTDLQNFINDCLAENLLIEQP